MTDKTSNVVLVILAAGASKRMGTPKQLLNWGKDTLIGHVITQALKTEATEVIVVLGSNFNVIHHRIKHFPVTILNNTNWHSGLGESIAFVSRHIMGKSTLPDGILITLADQPLVNWEYLNEMISTYSSVKHPIIATSYQKFQYGVPVLFSASYLKQLIQLNSDFGAKTLISKNEHDIWYLKPEFNNTDLDTMEDYKALHSLFFE
ncbi:nucleotidyltransferase family protein [Aestuariivivens sediminicola]|uniref:nucleotidyltransferase family protein n=1 Tax=Aestuariivivens sediminicola TaxID=2913560 RepID=UPI001F582166|nr:nucleotidyltransferase family protein [Aestuariivivens sediminicola]